MAQDLTSAEIAAKYGTSRRTIRRKIADGSIEPVRKLPGATGAYLFDPDDVARVFGQTSEDVAS